MIPGDIGAELARAIDAASAGGELPPGVRDTSSAAGTWRPAPAEAGSGPRTYATSLPFSLGEATGLEAAQVAALLAARLRDVSWITGASVTGRGYLTVTVTADTLAALAVRVTQAGDRCADSTALVGTERSAPADADLTGCVTWAQAWRRVSGAATGRLAAAAGAKVNFKTDTERPVGASPGAPAGQGGAGPRSAGADPGTVAAAVAFAGPDAIRYALVRTRTGRAVRIDAGSSVQQVLGNPFFAVRLAHADAASVLRWAADMRLGRGPGGFGPSRLALAPEQQLLSAISWLPERAAGAARRGRPDEFARYLEDLAAAYLDCRRHCPALPLLGSSAPRTAAGIRARLWLAAAAAAALGAGLRLLGIDAPDRV
jgi:arginyl-tRNA synthetase